MIAREARLFLPPVFFVNLILFHKHLLCLIMDCPVLLNDLKRRVNL